MRVAYIRTNGVNPDPRVEKEVNAIIKDKKNSVTILAWDRESANDSEETLELSNGIAQIVRFGIPSEWGGGMKKNMIPLLKFSRRVHSWLRKNQKQIDCVHCCDLPTAMMAMPYAKRKKFVYDIYDYFADTAHAPNLILKYAKMKEQKMIEIADATIICSEQRIKQIGSARANKLYIIHNSPDSCLLERVLLDEKHIIKGNSSRPKFVYVGNLIADRFITEVINIACRRKDIELHIGGMGVLSETVKQASEEHENIYFYGKLPYSDVLALENDCDVLLALYDPSIINNQFAAPNKFYEALLTGKPLIMIKNTGMDKVVKDNYIGAVANNPDEKSIEIAINKVIEMRSDWSKMAGKMKLLYQEQFSWEIMERRLCELYDRI